MVKLRSGPRQSLEWAHVPYIDCILYWAELGATWKAINSGPYPGSLFMSQRAHRYAETTSTEKKRENAGGVEAGRKRKGRN